METQVLDRAVGNGMGITAAAPIPVLDAVPSEAGETRSSPVWRTLVVVCVAAAMNLVFFPRAVLDRLSDLEPSPVVDTLVMTAEAVAGLADRTGFPAVFEGLRQSFLDAIAQ